MSELFISEPFNILRQSLDDLNKDRLQMLSILQYSFKKVNTEYKRMEHFKQSSNYVEPVQKTIGVSEDNNRLLLDLN